MINKHVLCIFVTAAIVSSWTTAQAACYGPDQQLPEQTTNDFLANPGQLLSQYPNGGGQMISRVRDLLASNPATLPAITNLLATASKDQQSAMGSGMGQAAQICTTRDQAFSADIQRAVAGAGSKEASDAYAAVTLNVPIGAAGAGGGGAGGGGGTGTGGPTTASGTGTTGSFGPTFTSNGTTNGFSTSTGSTFGGFSASAATSVSP